MPVLGIDVSHHQGEVDWQAVARSNVKFAYVKCAEGAVSIDPRFAENWAALGSTSLLRGAYFFARPGGALAGARAQADHFAAVLGDASAPRALPPALDIETDGGLPAEKVIDWVRAFVGYAEGILGRELIIYTGGLWRRVLGDPIVPELGTRMLWTARYGTQEPKLPKTWSRWDFWQFTDGVNGEVQVIPGVIGAVDCDRFRGDYAELLTLATGVA